MQIYRASVTSVILYIFVVFVSACYCCCNQIANGEMASCRIVFVFNVPNGWSKVTMIGKCWQFLKKIVKFCSFTPIKVKTLRSLASKCVLLKVQMIYQYKQPKNGLLDFVLEIWMPKMHLALVDQSPKKLMKLSE